MAERKSFLLRIDAGVMEAMQRWANDDLRSLNAQIEYQLREALRRSGRTPRAGDLPAEPGPSRGAAEAPDAPPGPSAPPEPAAAEPRARHSRGG